MERWLHEKKGVAQKFKLEIDGETRELLSRVKDFSPGNMSDNEVLKWALQELKQRKDPIEKAKRAAQRKEASAEQKTQAEKAEQKKTLEQKTAEETAPRNRALPAETVHAMNLRDESRCCQRNAKGERCKNTRWTQKHHIHLFSEGGSHELENMITLCPEHHDLVHQVRHEADQRRCFNVEVHKTIHSAG